MIFWIIVLAVLLYFLYTFFISLGKAFRVYPKTEIYHHFALLIPARNEEVVIGPLIESLQKQNYPKEAYDIYVLVNNSQDRTEEIALSKGAKRISMDRPVHSKADVLKVAFEKLVTNQEIEAYIIFDADNLVDAHFLENMNRAYGQGYRLYQGRRTGKNVQDNWLTSCYEVFYILQNMVFNHAHVQEGHSASLNGTAWMMEKSFLKDYGFSAELLTEDIELSTIALLHGEKIGYVHEAFVYDEYPAKLKTAWIQLKRWVFGQLQCMRKYTWQLLKETVIHRSLSCLDMVVILVFPLIVVLFFAIVIGMYFLQAGFARWLGKSILWILLVAYGLMLIVWSFAIRKNGSKLVELWKGMVFFPGFIFLFILLIVLNLFRKKIEWQAVVHDRKLRIEDMK
ncbi:MULTISPECIES: glycosyltransferase family 2 protein [Terrabacteria group]|uniref:glycosyltransferase family 2 protein n=1 Tax=Bacillati TaxID=1783272 RepID=UPI001C6F0FB2|nr:MULTISPECIES: glycosyltransferase family 2 protein [Terrabacteria group]MBW9212154.1 glycosyltransferase [Trueperella sp. zg.1013]